MFFEASRVRGIVFSGLLFLIPFSFAQATSAKPGDEPKKDTRVEPTSWGHVVGHVYDAKSGMPIPEAIVLGGTDEGFLDKGKSAGLTDSLGAYDIQLILGRISHNFDIGRALLSSPLGMLFGTATNTTKRIDVSRVALNVTAKGYKPFRGVVSARSTDAGKFRIDVQPILLSPDTDPGVSVAASGWNAIRIVRVETEPAIAKPKDKIVFRAYVQGTNNELAKTTEMAVFSELWKGAKKLKFDNTAAGGTVQYIGDYQVTGKEKHRAVPVWFAVTKAKVDFNPSQTERFALLQIANTAVEQRDFEARGAAIDSVRQLKLAPARDTFAGLFRSGSPEPFDWEMATDLNLQLGDAAAALPPAQKLWEADIKDRENAERYVEVLYRVGKDEEVIATCKDLVKGVKDRDLYKRISAGTLGLQGLSYVRRNDLKNADRINDMLLLIDGSGLSQNVIDFRGKLRLAEVEAAHTADPKSASALADYGRALLDLGRFEEAVAKLAESTQIDPQNAVQCDLAWAVLQMKGDQKPVVDLEKAVVEAKGRLGLEKGQQRSKDFQSWDQYGILLFALSEQKRAAAAPDAPAVRDEAMNALRDALTMGRKGAKRNAGYYSGPQFGFMSGSEVAISGFAYPQANATFLLLDSLRKLRRNDKDPIALFLNASSALIDLGQLSLASGYISELLALEPANVDGRFAEALIKHRQDDLEGAAGSLRKVIESAPNHPRANLVLADILTEMGDTVGAAERVAVHAAFYGEVKRK